MSKKIFMVGIIIFLSVNGFSGCIDIENYEEKILGKWLVGSIPEGDDDSVIFNFFSNDSFYVNMTEVDEYGTPTTQTAWMIYEITDDKFIMTIEGNEVFLDYSFSDNDQTLTLTEKDGSLTVLTRQ